MTSPANRLIHETSPYLLQHAHNPVDWFPWGDDALARARAEDRPIFLSIGYAACHWCHVMERESFEDPAIAARLNERFVNVKVDREERPDLDDIYMKFVQAMTGSGGWPMSVWLTPDGRPFFGGTYFPPDNRYGRASFPQVIDWVSRMWDSSRERLLEESGRMLQEIARHELAASAGPLDVDILDRSLEALDAVFDPQWGGFGSAPKFPHAMDIRLCFRHHRRTGAERARVMALTTLDRMARGGIYDHLGGGFARYSTDERWLIPHFEKMLYDNALLVPAYLDAFLVTGEARYARVARETCDFVLRELSTPEGGFGSTLDADSEGEEGRFYAWSPDDLRAVLGDELGREAAAWFDVRDGGNFEHGRSALWRPEDDEAVAARLGVDVDGLRARMEAARARLFEARAARVRPGYDDKVLVAWNGLMISALAQAAQVLDEPRYLDAARAAARYVLTGMRREDGRLYATARAGRAHLNAGLDDHAFLVAGLLELYETDFDVEWVRAARALDDVVLERFEDREGGGWFTTSDDHESLILRLKSLHDGALPAGSGVHVGNLLRLQALTGEGDYGARATRAIESLAGRVNRHPIAFSQLLLAVDAQRQGMVEVAVAAAPGSAESRAMLAAIRGTYRPQRVVAHTGGDADVVPLLRDRTHAPGRATAYVCRDFACRAPIDDPAALRSALEE